MENTKQSGFFDIESFKICTHPEHNIPSHIFIPQGKGYRHICPSCNTEVVIVPIQITF